MKKSIICLLIFLSNIILLSSCVGHQERELAPHLNSRPPALTMPYENPRYLLNSVPEQLPFTYIDSAYGELLGTIEDDDRLSGTILLIIDQSASDILEYYTKLFADSAFDNSSESYSYQVFFPPKESGAIFCNGQGSAVILEIYDTEDGFKDVRLHYTTDKEVIERTTCGQSIQVIGDYPFPYLTAPPNSSIARGGGGGGGGGGDGSRKGPLGFVATIEFVTEDSLEAVNNHYISMLVAEGWVLLNQSSTDDSIESSWDFGFYETRSWLARLIATAGDIPDQYHIELRAISP